MAMRPLTPWRLGRRSLPVGREYEMTPIDAFQREMNRLFDDFFKGFGMKTAGEEMEELGTFVPRVDMAEDENAFRVTAELPGMDEKDIDINLTREALTIKGEKKEEREEKGKGNYYMERSYGSFTRVLPVPGDIDPDHVEASFKNGVLNIVLPKVHTEKKDQKKIEIKSS